MLLGFPYVPGPVRKVSQLELFHRRPQRHTVRTYVRTPTFIQSIDQLQIILAISTVLGLHDRALVQFRC